MTPPGPSFENGHDHFAGRGNEFLEFYRSTAAGQMYVETKRRRIEEILPLGRHIDILDLGCGPGYITAPFAADGHRITLLDRDSTMLQTARSFVREQGIEHNYEIIQGNFENLTNLENDTFDIVLSFSALELCEFPLQAIKEMVRVCKPGGNILIVAANYLDQLKTGMRRLDLGTSNALLETGVYEAADGPKPHLMRGFRADELWGYFSSAGAKVEYIKADRILQMLLGDEEIEKLAHAWGLDECINLEMTLADDPALAGAGQDYCVLAGM